MYIQLTSTTGGCKTLPSVPPFALEIVVREITGTSAADTVAIVVGVKELTGADQVDNRGMVVTGLKKTDDCVSAGICWWNVGEGWGCICGGSWPPVRPGG